MPLYLTDAQIGRRLGLSAAATARVLAELDRQRWDRRKFPQPDPLFEGKRFWPAVEQWFLDYNGVRPPGTAARPADGPAKLEEDLGAYSQTRKARGAHRPRPAMAVAPNRVGGVLESPRGPGGVPDPRRPALVHPAGGDVAD